MALPRREKRSQSVAPSKREERELNGVALKRAGGGRERGNQLLFKPFFHRFAKQPIPANAWFQSRPIPGIFRVSDAVGDL